LYSPILILDELDADHVLAGAGCITDQALLGRDAEEVVDIDELTVLDVQRMFAEARAVGEQDALAVGGEFDVRQHLERDTVGIGGGMFGHGAGARVIGVLPARRQGGA